MPEEVQSRVVYSLYEVAQSIQKALSAQFPHAYWIKAELNKLNYYPHSGHCYPELVEKINGRVVAQMRSTLWRSDYIRVNQNFKQVLQEPLKDGIKILFLANVVYHPEYGLNLRILDIDPGFTLGDLEKEKQETIRQLKKEGIYERNKILPFPLLPQRLAIISVESSKGYADFLQVLGAAEQNWNYRFFHMLFPSLLQGDDAVPAMINQLRRIRKVSHHFDVVVIVRGGGGDIGLSCYNHYQLAREIALFPLPVLTGIGHATNETVAEMISYENAITPTKLAEMLIQRFHNFSVPVQQAQEKIMDRAQRHVAEEKNRFQAEIRLFRNVTQTLLQQNGNQLRENARTLIAQSQFIFKNQYEQHKLLQHKIVKDTAVYCAAMRNSLNLLGLNLKKDTLAILKERKTEMGHLETNLHNLKPENVLKRGYSITYLNQRAVSDFSAVKEGDMIQTVLYRGSITSTITHTTENHE